ncbi:hypothetical protein [Mycobacteroides abscessus]|uniref:hypothetical protein n=1 Tax=Mycobacteroides abscessus TaxID=36809 RepID=UPI0010C9D1EC|nr:hypothetical protein [Mycobacteroides abscessus]TKV35339.1 hypothetical protein CFA71_24025 [Mycobacteroides abscessus subsp. bolletii]
MTEVYGWDGYAQTWCRIMRLLLNRARNGPLNKNWRETLPDYWFVEYPIYDDAIADITRVALHNIIGCPLYGWEPYATNGDWEHALNRWYQQSNALCEYETFVEAEGRRLMAEAQRETKRARRAERIAELEKDPLSIHAVYPLGEINRIEERYDRDRKPIDDSWYHSQKASIEASYRAALNAGGQHNDWKRWYAEQLASIQPDTTVEEVLGRPFAPWFTRLPKFWTEPEPRTPAYGPTCMD